ncbi:MAG: autotransporter outer membrane beta-barrel domain-containing protein [Candidatus Moraniibacteriota bacterium]|jgi:hypothetical protein
MKKVTMVVLALVVGLINSTVVQANAKDQYHFWDVGVELSNIVYKEPGRMKESGDMIGITGSYAYHNNVMIKFEGVFKYGQVDYDGKLQNGTPITLNNIDDYITEIRGLSGYDFQVATTTITPYIGLGYRYLIDTMGSVFMHGYDRESNYLYSPIGLTTLTNLQNGWSVGVILEYDVFWRGTQKSYMSNLQHGYNDIKKDQHSGYGLRGSIKIQKSHFLIEPFIRYWNIGDSDISMLTSYGSPIGKWFFEPNNNSTEIGLRVIWRF